MPPAAPQNHDPALAHSIPVITSTSSAPAATLPNAMNQPDLANVQIPGLDQNQLMSLLRNLPGVFKVNKLILFFSGGSQNLPAGPCCVPSTTR